MASLLFRPSPLQYILVFSFVVVVDQMDNGVEQRSLECCNLQKQKNLTGSLFCRLMAHPCVSVIGSRQREEC